jgi:primosomal protein N'
LLSGPSERDVIAALQKLYAIMNYCNKKKQFELMGISPAFVSKVKRQFRWKLLVKAAEEGPLRQFVLYCMRKLRENDPLTGMTVGLALNPVNMD